MKKIVLMLTLVMFATTIFAASSQSTAVSMSDVISVTTSVEHGKKLTLKEKIALKKALKKQNAKPKADISKGLYILLAFVGLGWLAMGLIDDWSGNNWIICLALTVLLPWIGGFIFSLIKMGDYF